MEDPQALSRAIMALPGWRWMPRVVTVEGDTVIEVREDHALLADSNVVFPCRLDEMDPPNLSDPATGGCLLDLLGLGASVKRTLDGAWMVRVSTMLAPHPGMGVKPADTGWCPGASLGEASAVAAMVLGRWPDASR